MESEKSRPTMKIRLIFIVVLSLLWTDLQRSVNCQKTSHEEETTDPNDAHNQKTGESHLTMQVLTLIEHYKQDDPVGIPGLPVPDPMPVPDIKESLSLATLTMKNVLSYGLSKFRIKHVKTDLKDLNVKAGVQVDKMTVVGNYTLSTLFSKSSGPFTVILKNVFVEGNATLAVERDGKIRTQEIKMDITFSDMSMDFQNLGFMGSVFQSIMNSASNLVFDAIKPFMLSEAYTKIRSEIDSNLEKVAGDYSFPNSISPLDMAVAEGRKKVREMGYDPYKIGDYNHTVGVFGMQMTHTWITGGSSFYRVGNVSVSMENNTATIGLQVGTQKIMGSTQWELSVGKGMVTRAGHAQFTVDHTKVSVSVSQPLDIRQKAKIKDLQFELGNIQVRCDGAGTLDYLVEFAVNVLPNLLRYQIMDAIENPMKTRAQEMMNKFNLEQVIRERMPEFEKMGITMNFDFKMPEF